MAIARHNMPLVIDKKSFFCPRIKHCIDHVQHRKASPVTERMNEKMGNEQTDSFMTL